MNPPEILSASKINRFLTCPYSYYCHYILRRPQIRTPEGPREFGSAIHNIIVLYYDKLEGKESLEKIYEKIEEAFVEGSDYRVDSYRSRLKTVMANFKKFEKNRVEKGIGKPAYLERKFYAQPFPNLPKIEIIPDIYFSESRKIHDWKTGEHEEMDESRMIQGKTYEVVMRMNDLPVDEVVFNNLTLDRNMPLPKISDGWLEEKIRSIVESIEREYFPKKENGLCNRYCPYLLSCDLSETCSWGVL